MDTDRVLAQCEAMIRKGSSSFHKAFSQLPGPRREAVYVIYAFCRMIDDAVDEPERSPYTLDELEHQFLHLKEAKGHFIWPALQWLFESFPLSPVPFLRQMEGQRRDLAFTHYETFEQLESYCYLVAGTVGEMLLPVLHDHPSEGTVHAGIHLGKAMQIVNIVRDIGEDRDRGRRYLPMALLEKHGYSQAAFESGVVDERLVACVGELKQLADNWFAIGLSDLDSYPPDSAFSVALAAGYYRAILDEVQRGGYEVYTRRAVVGLYAKKKIYGELKQKFALLTEFKGSGAANA